MSKVRMNAAGQYLRRFKGWAIAAIFPYDLVIELQIAAFEYD